MIDSNTHGFKEVWYIFLFSVFNSYRLFSYLIFIQFSSAIDSIAELLQKIVNPLD